MPKSPRYIEAQDAISRHTQHLHALLSTLSSSDALEGLPPAMLANLMWLALELLQQLIEAQGVTEAVAMEGEL